MSTNAFRLSRELFSRFHFAICAEAAIAFAFAPLLAASIVCGSTQLAHANSPNDTTHTKLKSVESASLVNECLLNENDSGILILAPLKTTYEPTIKMFGAAHTTVDMLSELTLAITTYRSRFASLTTTALKKAKAAVGKVIFGTASTYNPNRPDKTAGGTETASGEPYNAKTWTAAIKTNLRDKFGGVHYGKNYQPTYALVESADKRVIVKINDVGPLKPGRTIDLNERTMRYFDPTMELGLIPNVSVTPLPGDGWTPGPIEGDRLIGLATKLEKLASVAQ
jgi:rare lipoprotein A